MRRRVGGVLAVMWIIRGRGRRALVECVGLDLLGFCLD